MMPDERREALGEPNPNERRAWRERSAELCNPHVPCPSPMSCNADQVCIYRCEWLPDNVGNRSKLAIQAAAATDYIRGSKYQRHTVDIQQPPPQHVEDDSLAVERGAWWAKVVWMVLGVAFVVYVLVRIWVGGGQ